jgi:hypothetical protein
MNEIPPHDSRIISFPFPAPQDMHGSPALKSELREAIAEGFDALDDDLVDKADLAAINSEGVFLQRFAFDAPREHRKQIINLKYQCDLTDREISFLQSVGALKFGISDARISAHILLTMCGWVQLFCLSALMSFAFLAASRVDHVSMAQIGALAAFEFALLGVAAGVFHLYIRPYRIARRAARNYGKGLLPNG